MGHHEITEEPEGFSLNLVQSFPNQGFGVILKPLNQHETTMIRLNNVGIRNKYRPSPTLKKKYAGVLSNYFFYPFADRAGCRRTILKWRKATIFCAKKTLPQTWKRAFKIPFWGYLHETSPLRILRA